MASKRLLKREINDLTYDLISECYTYKHFHPDISSEKISSIIDSIVLSRNELITRINQIPAGDSKEVAKHFKSIENDLRLMVTHLDKIES
jgi:hypothetical protein